MNALELSYVQGTGENGNLMPRAALAMATCQSKGQQTANKNQPPALFGEVEKCASAVGKAFCH